MDIISKKLKKIKCNLRYCVIFIIAFSFILSLNSYGQHKVKDTMLLKIHSPTKATLMSVALPGLGQAYNKKYWKIPIIYGGGVAVYYFVKTNHKSYTFWKNEYKSELAFRKSSTYDINKDKYPNYSEQDFITLRDYYRRNLELTYIIGGALYLLNILDAAVDANLYDYNINDNLSLRLAPLECPSYDKNLNFAMKLTYKF